MKQSQKPVQQKLVGSAKAWSKNKWWTKKSTFKIGIVQPIFLVLALLSDITVRSTDAPGWPRNIIPFYLDTGKAMFLSLYRTNKNTHRGKSARQAATW
ncbi:hypothetical protein ARMGADRAFT_788786 [Armillaria gallica]|uniref:Uncharacterized protein n=1 Tax=Armillaria gallica TaxID=47427 RepID=A0A2H3DIX0_ARMGA|nr:hypothetical protein ARMGADRAFT_788786 [Armillaria gallica]